MLVLPFAGIAFRDLVGQSRCGQSLVLHDLQQILTVIHVLQAVSLGSFLRFRPLLLLLLPLALLRQLLLDRCHLVGRNAFVCLFLRVLSSEAHIVYEVWLFQRNVDGFLLGLLSFCVDLGDWFSGDVRDADGLLALDESGVVRLD